MPTLDDTWMFPNTCVPSTSTGTEHNHLDMSASCFKICSLCGDDFHTEENPMNTSIKSPCDDLSCAECTWLQRNRDSTCQRCATRFACPSLKQPYPSSKVDGRPTSSHQIVVLDGGYDGDDERGAISSLKTRPIEHAHHDPTNWNTVVDFTRPAIEVREIHPQRSQSKYARKAAARPSSGQQELRIRKMRVWDRRRQVNGTEAHDVERNGSIRLEERRESLNKTRAETE